MRNKIEIIFMAVFVSILFFTSPALPAETIKIGVTMPLTGYAATYGEDAKRGVQYAVDEANGVGGINGKKIEPIYEDDGGVGKTGVAAIRKLVNVTKVPVILDGMMSSVALPASPICRKNKVVFLGSLTSHPDLTSPGGYIYRIAPSDRTSAYVMAKYVFNELKLKKAGMLIGATDYGVSVEKLAKKKFTELGGEFIFSDKYAQGATDFRTQLTKLKSANPEALFIVATHKEAAGMLRQMVEMDVKIKVMGTSFLDDPNFITLAGNAAEGVYYDTLAKGKSEEANKKNEEFNKKFMAKFNKEPGICARHYYDIASLAILAMREGGETGPEIDQYLSKVKDFIGVTGSITFTETGDRITPVMVKIIKDGKAVETGYVDFGN